MGPGPHPHLPSSPRMSLVAWPSKFPQSPHTWLLCLCSSRTWGGGGGGAHTRSRARSAPAMQAVSTLPAPPGGLLFSWVILIFKWGGGRQ